MYDKGEVDKLITKLEKKIENKDKEIAKLKEQVALLQAEFTPEPG